MKKNHVLIALMLALTLLLSACSSPPPVEEEPTEAPTEAPTPTMPVVTMEPTISPRPMEGTVEWPTAPDATLMTIDPIDKPTPPPLEFGEYRTYESANLGIKLDIPVYFGDPTGDIPSSQTIVFEEPLDKILSGAPFPAAVTIAVSSLSSDQTERDAQNHLDIVLNTLRAEYPNMETSSQASNSMMEQKGSYVSYWIDMPIEGGAEGETFRMRGRCVVIPNGKNLYMVRTFFPSTHNYEYDEKIFKKIRSTFNVL